jgi:hypothetical protein
MFRVSCGPLGTEGLRQPLNLDADTHARSFPARLTFMSATASSPDSKSLQAGYLTLNWRTVRSTAGTIHWRTATRIDVPDGR